MGSNAIDLVGVDRQGSIVVVECKLEANREARRQVIGQILEYAGQLHGMEYEEFERLPYKAISASLASHMGQPLADIVEELLPAEAEWSRDDFRNRVQESLRDGDFRLVIAINGMNDDLEGIIEYLNSRGGVRLEALEIQQFNDSTRPVQVLVPEVDGTRITPGGGVRAKKKWDWDSFAVDAKTECHLEDDRVGALQHMFNALQNSLGAKIEFGTGATYASFGPKWPFSSVAPITFWSVGS